MHDDSVEDALSVLAAALAVTPSADGPARVRMRVADTRPRWVSRRWVGIAAVAAATSALATVATISIATSDRRQSPPAPSVATGPRAKVAALPLTAVIPAPALVARRPSRPPVARLLPPEPEVLVSPDQMVAFQQLRALLQSGRLAPDAMPGKLVEHETGIGSPAAVERPGSTGGLGGTRDPRSNNHQQWHFANN